MSFSYRTVIVTLFGRVDGWSDIVMSSTEREANEVETAVMMGE